MINRAAVKKDNEANNETDNSVSNFFALMTYLPVMFVAGMKFDDLIEKVPHDMFSDTQKIAAGFVAVGAAHVGLGRVFDAIAGKREKLPTTKFAFAISAAMAIGGTGAQMHQKAETFDRMATSVARECFNDNLPQGTEVVRHRHADAFYTYKCPEPDARLGPRTMPEDPVRQKPITFSFK